jgi:hypothetical protein
MKNNLLQLFFLIAFCLVIFSVPVFWLSQNGNWISTSPVENRSLQRFPSLPFHDFRVGISKLIKGNILETYNFILKPFISRSFQAQLDQAVKDQFPFRIFLTTLSKSIERLLIKASYSLVFDPAFPASLTTNYYILKAQPFYIQPPAIFKDSKKQIIDKRIENYAQIIREHPDVNFFGFYFERMAFAPFNPMARFYPNADNGRSYKYFSLKKPEGLIVSEMYLKDLDDYQEKFFRTDHHWNIRGAWQAYEVVYEMLKKKYPEISPKLVLKEFKSIPGLKFCGSYARRTLYPCSPDIFEYAKVSLPEFTTFVNGEEKPFGNKKDYLDGNFSHDKFANHYAEFFGPVVALVEYRFENTSDRNLLIIGGSYKQAMQEFVASHYKNTYAVDLREYEDFSLGKFIKDKRIDDVLVVGDIIVYGRLGWLINP